MPIYALADSQPVIDDSAYVHPSAEIIGDVIIEANCFIAPNAVLRGDFGRIHIHHHSNIQDNCVLHSFPGKHCIVSEYGHVGHASVLHGCTLEANVLVGMNTVVMDEAVIAENSVIGAQSFVASGFTCQPGSLILGSPASVKRQLKDKEINWKRSGTDEYVQLAQRYIDSVRLIKRADLSNQISEQKSSDIDYQYKPEA